MRKPITVAWVNTIRKKLNNNVEGLQEKRKTTLQMIHNLEKSNNQQAIWHINREQSCQNKVSL